MPAITVDFIVDAKGRKKSVVMSYRDYLKLLEDIDDLRTKFERNGETPEDFDSLLADLRDSGVTRDPV